MLPLNLSADHATASSRKRSGIGMRIPSTLILGLLLPLASVACAQPAPAHTARRDGSAAPAAGSKPSSRASSRASKRKKLAAGWHYFGESSSASPQPPAPGVWHHFGSADEAPASGALPAGDLSATRSSDYSPEANLRRSAPVTQYDASHIVELERQMFRLINLDRRKAGVRPLRWSAKLTDVARSHSRSMIRQGYFGHDTPEGKTVGERLMNAGIDWHSVGENIAISPTVSQAETDFMDEPRHQENHRWNILNTGYTEVGVGIARDSNGELYITQDFMGSPSGT